MSMATPWLDKNPSFNARRRHAVWTWAALSAVFVVSGLVPAQQLARVPQLCLLHALGWPCLGCGLSRGFCALSHGQWQNALDFNPLTPFVYALFIGLWAHAAYRALHPKP
mgnify:CR=1 FL=1